MKKVNWKEIRRNKCERQAFSVGLVKGRFMWGADEVRDRRRYKVTSNSVSYFRINRGKRHSFLHPEKLLKKLCVFTLPRICRSLYPVILAPKFRRYSAKRYGCFLSCYGSLAKFIKLAFSRLTITRDKPYAAVCFSSTGCSLQCL